MRLARFFVLLALAACGGSPSSDPAASPTPTPTPPGLQLRVLSAELPTADCPSPAPTANPPAGTGAALPGPQRCYQLNEALLVVPAVADAVASERDGIVTIRITLPADLRDDLEKATSDVINREVALIFEGRVLGVSPVREPFANGEILISGTFSRTDADEVATKLKTLASPTPADY